MSTDFRALALSPALLEVVSELGFEKLTAIQAAAIPVLLDGRDLIGQSKTGSGKTAAFALPLLQKLDLQASELQGLVLCPTRELCAQVVRDMRKLGRKLPGLRVLALAGGEPVRGQSRALTQRVHIVVGTPGRVLDHVRRGNLQLRDITLLVLDEADRMLEMGFAEDMQKILDATPKTRQTVFFSATFPESIAALSRKYQRDPTRVTIEAAAVDKRDIQQLLVVVEADAKPQVLVRALQQYPHQSALVFANLKSSVAELAQTLQGAGMSAAALHGDLEQYDRDRVMAKFRNASSRVLVATDVAARGIDVASLDLVVNYDLPAQPEVYVHRIGRTGRAGKTGVAISLATARDKPRIAAIEQATGVQLERTKLTGERKARESAPAAKMDTLQISGGRKHKVRPADILGALTGEAGGLAGTDIGKIEIHDNFSYVAVAKRVSQKAQQSLNNGRIKGSKFRVTLVK